jgi:hypothetical protein
VLRQAPDFDWARLVARADEWGFVPEVRDALGVIASESSLSALVPGAVLADLAALPTTAYDEFMHRAVTSWRAQLVARRMHYWYLYRSWALANGRRPSLRQFGRLTRDLTERDDLIAYFLWRRRRVKREKFGVA